MLPRTSAAQVSGDTRVDEFRRFVSAHPRLLVLTGAGVSTASGIPDYRDSKGRWKRPEPIRFQQFMESDNTRKRYWARSLAGWSAVATARPGPAHMALAALEAQGRLQALVTQNVDGLHQAAGSRNVQDLHGRIDRVVCMDCAAVSDRAQFQTRLLAANVAWAAQWQSGVARVAPDGDADLPESDFSAFSVPDCGRCGGVLKPDVVFFGEAVPKPHVDAVYAQISGADAMLVAGSSLMVFSGFRFAREAVRMGKPLAILNIGDTRADRIADLKLALDCGEVLQACVKHD